MTKPGFLYSPSHCNSLYAAEDSSTLSRHLCGLIRLHKIFIILKLMAFTSSTGFPIKNGLEIATCLHLLEDLDVLCPSQPMLSLSLRSWLLV